jgi:hypothetical protein
MNLNAKQPFGEIIASTLTSCTIQAWDWDIYPTPGTLITIEEPNEKGYAIIQSVETAPLDGTRIPTAYKKDLATLKAEHPHIFLLLRTTLTCMPLDTPENSHRPASLHSFCRGCSREDIVEITKNSGFIKKMLMHMEPTAADLLIEAHIRYLKKQQCLSQTLLRMIIAEYVTTIGSDYKRILHLNTMVQRIEL